MFGFNKKPKYLSKECAFLYDGKLKKLAKKYGIRIGRIGFAKVESLAGSVATIHIFDDTKPYAAIDTSDAERVLPPSNK